MIRTINVIFLSFAFFTVTHSSEEDHSLETCLRKDSISCVQIHLYKKLRALLAQETIELLGGFRIVKEKSKDSEKSLSEENNTVNIDIYNALEVSDKQLLLEDIVFNKMLTFFKTRKIQWNLISAVEEMMPAVKKFLSKVPVNVKEKLVHYAAEGRGKKKFMRLFVPVIIAFKMTVFTWVKVIYLGVALLAKKAIVISIIALMIAIFVAIKKHSYKEYRQPHYEYHGETIHPIPYYPVSWPSGGHPVHSVYSGQDSYDTHASQSSPAHYLAYSAQKPNHS